jgi:hypothetical protein
MRMCLVVGVAGDLRGEDGGIGGAVFQGPRMPVAAAAVHATAAVGAVEGRRSAGMNCGCAFGGAKSGVRYFLNRQCDISNHVPDVKPKKNPKLFGCWLGSKSLRRRIRRRYARASARAARRISLPTRRESIRRAHPYPPCHFPCFLARDIAARLGVDGGEWLMQCLLLIGLVDGAILTLTIESCFARTFVTC